MVFGQIRLFILFIFTVFSLACTRTVDTNMGIRLQIPTGKYESVSGQAYVPSNERLTYVAINVTGAGMSRPVVYIWEGHDSSATPPQYFEVTVPSGASRLVQALAVYEFLDQGGEKFYYGDSTLNVQSDSTVNIEVMPVSADLGRSTVAGRYVDVDDTMSPLGPTGRIVLKFAPVGKPKMIVHHGEMFGGVFNIRAFTGSNALFDYELENGLNLFGGPMTLDQFTTLNSQIMKVNIPDYYEEREGNFRSVPEFYNVVGWFGPLAGGRTVCYPPGGNVMPDAYIDSSGTDPLEWAVGYVVGGGSQQTEDMYGLCDAGSEQFTENLSYDSYVVDSDSVIGNLGPYRTKLDMNNRRQALNLIFSSSFMLNWEYLPRVITHPSYPNRKGIDGSVAFYRYRPTSNDYDDDDIRSPDTDGYVCDKLTSMGFSQLFDKPANPLMLTDSASIPSGSLPSNFELNYRLGRLQILLCPYQNTSSGKRFFSSAAKYQSHEQQPSLFVVRDGETFTAGGVTGTPNIISISQTGIPVKLYAVHYISGIGYVKASGYSGLVSLIVTGSATLNNYPSTVGFVDGEANFTFDTLAIAGEANIDFLMGGFNVANVAITVN